MSDTDTSLAVQTRPLATDQLAAFIGMEKLFMLDTIRAQCFRTVDKNGQPIEVSDEQVAAFVSIAVEMKVNPLLPGMLYAYPKRGGGVTPIMGPDGVFKKLSEHPAVDGWNVKVFPEDVTLKPTHAVATIYRKGSTHPIEYTALLSEWAVSDNPNWAGKPRHMLGLRALKHAARQVIHGLPYDEDDRRFMEETELNVTPGAAPITPETRADPAALRRGPGRPKKGANAEPPAEPAAQAAIDIEAKAAETTPAAEVEKKAEPIKADPSGATGTIVPLADKAPNVIKSAKIVKAAYEAFNGKHGATAQIESPEFTGTVYDLSGGRDTKGANGVTLDVLPVWLSPGPVRIELHGSFSKKRGYCLAIVDKVEPITEDEIP